MGQASGLTPDLLVSTNIKTYTTWLPLAVQNILTVSTQPSAARHPHFDLQCQASPCVKYVISGFDSLTGLESIDCSGSFHRQRHFMFYKLSVQDSGFMEGGGEGGGGGRGSNFPSSVLK